jgi:hypothetical protein
MASAHHWRCRPGRHRWHDPLSEADRQDRANNLQLSITAEDNRAHTAEKRRVYARTLSAFNGLISAAGDSRSSYTQIDDDERDIPHGKQYDAMFAAWELVNELRLIGPDAVAGIGLKLMSNWVQFVQSSVTLAEALTDEPSPEDIGPDIDDVGKLYVQLLVANACRPWRASQPTLIWGWLGSSDGTS